ncbi:MAG: hypothetical protein ABII06_11630, partial [Pseudomonadota bacterium]
MERKSKKMVFFNETRETMEWEKRTREHNREFIATYQNAFRNSRAYQESFRAAGIGLQDIQGIEDLEKLPLVRMDDLEERQKADPPFGGFETVDPGLIRRIYINPGLLFQPGERDYRDTTWAEALCGAGFKAGDRIVNTFNYHLWPYAFMLDDCVNMIGATVIPTGVGNTLMQVKIMQMLKANGFLGTPSFLMTLSQRAEGL